MGPAARLVKKPARDKRANLKNTGFMVPAHRWRRRSISRSAEKYLQSMFRARASRATTTEGKFPSSPAEAEGQLSVVSGWGLFRLVFDLPQQAPRLLYGHPACFVSGFGERYRWPGMRR